MTPPDAHDPLLLLLAGMVLDAIFGDMPALFAYVPHPVALAGRAIAYFERKLNRPQRSERRRRERGIVTVIVLVSAAAAIGWALQWACRLAPVGAIFEALIIAVMLTQRESSVTNMVSRETLSRQTNFPE